jgi:hypothetical protein
MPSSPTTSTRSSPALGGEFSHTVDPLLPRNEGTSKWMGLPSFAPGDHRGKNAVREGSSSPHPDLRFVRSSGQIKDAFLGPVRFMTVGADGKTRIHPVVANAAGAVLKDCGYDLRATLTAFGSPAYQEGWDLRSDFPPQFHAELGTGFLKEMTSGFKMRLKPECMSAMESELPSVKVPRLLRLAQEGSGIHSPLAHEAFMKGIMKGSDKGWIMILPTAEAVKIPNLQLSPVYMREEKPGKYRMIQDLKAPIGELGFSINEATDMEEAPEIKYGETPANWEWIVYNVLVMYDGSYVILTKRDVDGAFNRFHVSLEDVALFAFMISKAFIGINLKLAMGWTASPSFMSVTTDAIASAASTTPYSELPDAVSELEHRHRVLPMPSKRSTTTIRGKETVFRGRRDALNPGLSLAGGLRSGAYVGDLLAVCLRDDALAGTRALGLSITLLYRPLDPREDHFRTACTSDKKYLTEGPWGHEQMSLGTGYCAEAGEAFITPDRLERFIQLLATSFPGYEVKRWATLADLETLIGTCQSLAKVKPQGLKRLARLYQAISGLRGKAKRKIRLTKEFFGELEIWRRWSNAPDRVSLNNIVRRSPTIQGFSDAAGTRDGGMGGYWLLGGGKVIWWREMFPHDITNRLSRYCRKTGRSIGDIDVNELELCGLVGNVTAYEIHQPMEPFEVLRSDGDNKSTVAWNRRGMGRGQRATMCLDELSTIEERTRCNVESEFVAGVRNLADYPSRSLTAKFGRLTSQQTQEGLAKLLKVDVTMLEEVKLPKETVNRLFGILRMEKWWELPEEYDDTIRLEVARHKIVARKL